jgi:undecaprenyl-phosphate 4-deoxy-4-formamido-L-arabinose transferase
VVIPVYNGAATIGAVVEALARLPVADRLDVVLVYDGSPDNSLAVCRALAAEGRVPITVVEHSRNYGEHNAVMSGLRRARGRFVITMDDDLQNPPEEVQRLYEYTRDSGYEVVYTRYDEKQHEGWRNLGSAMHNRMADLLLDKPRGLYLSSFRCMSGFVASEVSRNDGPFPYVDGLILQVTQSLGTLTVKHLPRAEGRSNYTIARLFRLWLSMALNFSVIPLRVASLFGMALCGIGFLGLIEVIVEALLETTPSGWSSTLSVILLLSGGQLLLLGVLGEYVGRMFLTINRRPQSVVKSVTTGEREENP